MNHILSPSSFQNRAFDWLTNLIGRLLSRVMCREIEKSKIDISAFLHPNPILDQVSVRKRVLIFLHEMGKAELLDII